MRKHTTYYETADSGILPDPMREANRYARLYHFFVKNGFEPPKLEDVNEASEEDVKKEIQKLLDKLIQDK